MIDAWASGDDAGSVRWQAELWRRLRARIGVPGPAERRDEACARLDADRSLVDLPSRFSLFGLTRLPAGQLSVLRALASQRDVHLFLLHPSPALWDEIAAATRDRPAAGLRSEDPTAAMPINRLLASWGRDARELQLVVTAAEGQIDHPSLAGVPLGHPAGAAAGRRPREPPRPSTRPPLLDPGDQSIQVHACHGRARQVEVLRDAILHALADDPTLEPRDVIVMCPDIEAFAPLIQATFGAGRAPRTRPSTPTPWTCASGWRTARCARPTRSSASSRSCSISPAAA